MHRRVHPLVCGLALVLASAPSLSAQSRSPKPGVAMPGSSGPATLEATMTSYGAWIRWPPVPNATGYNVTRVTSAGTPETLISARATVEYAFEGNNCMVGSPLPYCVYFDNQFRTTASNLTVTYRVYAIVPSARAVVTSAPSPSAALLWNCPGCPKLP
jgi:hypothetical protein